MNRPLSLTILPREILYGIIKELDRPDKLALGLASPYFLACLADYYDLDRYRSNPEAWKKIGLPEGVPSWHDSAAQATIIRYLAAAGYGDIEIPSGFDDGDDEDHETHPSQQIFSEPNLCEYLGNVDGGNTAELPPSYEDSDEAVDDEMVELHLSEWLEKKFGILDGCIVCADCSRFIRCSKPDGSVNPTAASMLHRPRLVNAHF